jgi:predicted TIM-barrel fold metal-dependent hydrolase
MIIDCHTHLGRNEHIKCTADELLASMDKAGIDQALVFAGDLNDCPNEWMIEQIKPHRDRLHGVMAYNHPHFRWNDFFHMAQDNDIKGIKFYTGYDHYYPLDLYENKGEKPYSSYFYNPLQVCSELGIPAIFHCGDCLNSVKCAKLKYANPLNIDEAAVDYDDVKFVIAHMAYPFQREAAEVCYKNANVYSDISGFVYGKFNTDDCAKFRTVLDEFIAIAGTDKLLFGTDSPISDQSDYVKVVDSIYLFGKITAEALSKNVAKVFNLK